MTPITSLEKCKLVTMTGRTFSNSYRNSESYPSGCWATRSAIYYTENSGQSCGTGGYPCVCLNEERPEITVEGNVKFNLRDSGFASSPSSKIFSRGITGGKNPEFVVKNADSVSFHYSRAVSLPTSCSVAPSTCGDGATCISNTTGVECVCKLFVGVNASFEKTCRMPHEAALSSGSWEISGNTITSQEYVTLLSAPGKRHFTVKGGTLVLKHIVLKGGGPAKGNGGAVQMIGGALIAINVTFAGNRAAADSSGGALYAWNARNIMLSGVTFKDNFAPAHGGAIFGISNSTNISQEIIIKHSSAFLANRAEEGGSALYLKNIFLMVTDSVFETNTAEHGAVLYADISNDGSLNIRSSKVKLKRFWPMLEMAH